MKANSVERRGKHCAKTPVKRKQPSAHSRKRTAKRELSEHTTVKKERNDIVERAQM